MDGLGYSIRPAPGTCCPEMNIVNGVCEGCGKVWRVDEGWMKKIG